MNQEQHQREPDIIEEQYQQQQEDLAAFHKAEQARLKGDWATPEDFKSVVIPRFKLNFDAAADKGNSLCRCYLNEEDDALTSLWSPTVRDGAYTLPRIRVWLNPPHRKFLPWFEKAREQITHPDGRVDIVVIMALPSFSSKWWRRYAEKSDEIIDLSPRVQFVPPEGLETNNSGNSRERCLIVFRREPRHPLAPARYTWHWKEEKKW